MPYDVIVVGGGSAGCGLAGRLSEDRGRTVLLVEAGPDYPTVGDLPADIADASSPTASHDWGFVAEADDLARSVSLPRGRLVGGCAATNAGFLLRGAPADYDEWAALGNPEWSFEDLLPTLRAVEADADFTDAWHGVDGPIPVRRPSVDELSPIQHAFADAAVTAGHVPVGDHNRPGAVGIGPLPRNVRDGMRMSTALTHLAVARTRPNLTIRADTLVDQVLLSEGRAAAIRLVGGEVVTGDRVVLAAGSYGSPAILLRSGIGPVAHLRDMDVPVVVGLPGVGSNLVDHPLVAVDQPASAATQDRATRSCSRCARPSRSRTGPPICTCSPPGRSTAPGAPAAGSSASSRD